MNKYRVISGTPSSQTDDIIIKAPNTIGAIAEAFAREDWYKEEDLEGHYITVECIRAKKKQKRDKDKEEMT